MTQPLVSFVIASFNSREFLRDAVQSALRQRGVSVEVLVVDDHSSDGSHDHALALAGHDDRIRVLQTEMNQGPSGARNVGIAAACGEWIAVLDSDDLIDPERSATLLAEANFSGADLVADDLLLFDDERKVPPQLFLSQRRSRAPSWIGLADYLEESRMFGAHPNLGFLKPMFRRAFLAQHAIRYDPALRIAEDDAVVISCLRAGARYRLVPQPMYFYRKHGSSTTVVLGTTPANAMQEANQRLLAELAPQGGPVAGAMRHRAAAMTRAWAFTHVLHALRRRDVVAAARVMLRYPQAVRLAYQPILARLQRVFPPRAMEAAPGGPVALVVSKQRLAGAVNGSSAYLLAIVEELRRSGHEVHLLHPSDSMFGRTPFYRLGPVMGVFGGIHAVRAARLGNWLIARSPRIWLSALRGIAARLGAGLGLVAPGAERRAPWSVGTPWTREATLAVARCAGLRPSLVVADYVFCTDAFAAVCDPGARTVTVMHDLFSSRGAQFADGADSVASLAPDEEAGLLARADVVLAIQQSEADFVATHAPATEVLHVPMPACPVDHASEGEGDRVLFVGSDTAPNIVGLKWFLSEVWPVVQAQRPSLRLDVAGTVRNAFGEVCNGVTFHGVVPDLTALYQQAGIVISPLLQGSGLKIKLIDALAQGKACVVTGVTLQGVEWLADQGALIRADDAAAFSDAILHFATDPVARQKMAEEALSAARIRFGGNAAFATFRRWLSAR